MFLYEALRDDSEKTFCYKTTTPAIPKHHHSSIEILYIYDGNANVNINDKVHPLSVGQYCIISCNAVHYINCSDDCKAIVTIIPITVVPRLSKLLLENSFTTCCFSDGNDKTAFNLMNMLYEVSYGFGGFAGNKSKFELIANYSELLLNFIIGQTELVKKVNRSIPTSMDIVNYISVNYHSDLPLSKLAKEFGYSTGHVAEIVKCQIGMSIRDYVNMLRINEAKELILRGCTNEVVCQKVGFSCVRTFLRTFERLCGLTPAEYKAQAG